MQRLVDQEDGVDSIYPPRKRIKYDSDNITEDSKLILYLNVFFCFIFKQNKLFNFSYSLKQIVFFVNTIETRT
jgi:hypothetical protein